MSASLNLYPRAIALLVGLLMAGPAMALDNNHQFDDLCDRDYAQCTSQCDAMPPSQKKEACIGLCGIMLVNCYDPPTHLMSNDGITLPPFRNPKAQVLVHTMTLQPRG